MTRHSGIFKNITTPRKQQTKWVCRKAHKEMLIYVCFGIYISYLWFYDFYAPYVMV
jgi:hypothetical protein